MGLFLFVRVDLHKGQNALGFFTLTLQLYAPDCTKNKVILPHCDIASPHFFLQYIAEKGGAPCNTMTTPNNLG